jgi:hypothetical protein
VPDFDLRQWNDRQAHFHQGDPLPRQPNIGVDPPRRSDGRVKLEPIWFGLNQLPPNYGEGLICKYGYLNRVRSIRRLEVETHRNIEVIWLLWHLKPDFKT